MDMCDFSYNGETLSEHGYVLCDFEAVSSASPVTTDSQKTYNQIKMLNGKWYPILYTSYEEPLTISFYICKNTDSTGSTGETGSTGNTGETGTTGETGQTWPSYYSDLIITPAEAAAMKRWLNTNKAYAFKILAEPYSAYHWYGSFNVEEVHSESECVGLRLTFTSTAPFAYKDMVIIRGSVTGSTGDTGETGSTGSTGENNGNTVTIEDTSDEIGYIYPDISVTLNESGDLSITNSFDGRSTIVANCSNEETITFTNLLQIMSSDATRNVSDDFNFRFVRISNEYGLRTNVLTFSLACDYTISYEPIAKVVFS